MIAALLLLVSHGEEVLVNETAEPLGAINTEERSLRTMAMKMRVPLSAVKAKLEGLGERDDVALKYLKEAHLQKEQMALAEIRHKYASSAAETVRQGLNAFIRQTRLHMQAQNKDLAAKAVRDWALYSQQLGMLHSKQAELVEEQTDCRRNLEANLERAVETLDSSVHIISSVPELVKSAETIGADIIGMSRLPEYETRS